jgi:hypothetical protein
VSLLNKKKKRRRLSHGALRAGCPFCWEWLPVPEDQPGMFAEGGTVGGRCQCGAFFVVDETGKRGGSALLDLKTLACDGDMDRAMALREGDDYAIESKPLAGSTVSYGGRTSGRALFEPRVWALKLG